MNAHLSISLEDLIRLKADARGFSFLPRQPVASLLSGRHGSRLRGRGLAFEELRRYQQGDDIRTIDWKATARLRTPYVRVYTEERERSVLFVLDQRQSMYFGSRRTMKSVLGAEVAALATWRSLSVGDRVGGIIFNDSEIVDLKPQGSQSRALRLLHEVVRFNQKLTEDVPFKADAKISLNRALEVALRRATHDNLVILISDLDGADAETERLATLLSAHNDVIVVATYDPLGVSLAARPGMVANTAAGPVEVPSHAGFEPAFEQAFSELLHGWMTRFHALKVPVLPLSTVEPAAAQLRGFFGGQPRA